MDSSTIMAAKSPVSTAPEGGADVSRRDTRCPRHVSFARDQPGAARYTGKNSPENCIFSGARNRRAFGYNSRPMTPTPARAPRPAPAFFSRRGRSRSKDRSASASPRWPGSWPTACTRGASSTPRTIRSSPISTRKKSRGGLPRADVFPDRAPSPPQ